MMECPICPFSGSSEYELSLHFEETHFSDDSPFVAKDAAKPHPDGDLALAQSLQQEEAIQMNQIETDKHDDDDEYLPCPEDGCGEWCLFSELQLHLDLHLTESIEPDEQGKLFVTNINRPNIPDQGSSSAKFALSRKNTSENRNANLGKRLGKRELGPYAFEDHMPQWLYNLLRKGAKKQSVRRISPTGQLYLSTAYANEVHGMIPVLAKLLDQDVSVQQAWLCHPGVQHVYKMRHEGGFCGYRNCQMLFSHILNARWPGWENVIGAMGADRESVSHRIPGILLLQDLIERAWDMGFNARCRTETGGIKGTRKYIGTPDCQALLQSLFMDTDFKVCHDTTFKDAKDNRNVPAHERLFADVESYFGSPQVFHQNGQDQYMRTRPHGSNVTITSHPPIYLQQPGHSISIVGFERRTNGTCNILVLDPGYSPSPGILKELERMNQHQRSDAAIPRSATTGAPADENVKPQSQPKSGLKRNTDGKLNGWIRRRDGDLSSSTNSQTSDGLSATGSKRKSELPSLRAGLLGLGNPPVSSSASARRSQADAATKRSNDAFTLLRAYRREARHLYKHSEFEMVMLKHPASASAFSIGDPARTSSADIGSMGWTSNGM